MKLKEHLIELNKRGLIHAPDESDENFFLRCHQATPLPSSPQSSLVEELFDVNPDWVPLIFRNQGLHLWEGGCTWIERDRVTLQLNKAFEKKRSYLGYSREEVIAHELVHVVRGHFEEPIFEEILAYQTSSSPFRRFLGPLFRTSKETTSFLITLCVVLVALFVSPFQLWIYLGTLGVLGGWQWRLLRAHRLFSRTRKKLSSLVGKKRALAVMLRLTDREIIRFSKMSKEEICDYVKKMHKIQIRWQQISAAYFSTLLPKT